MKKMKLQQIANVDIDVKKMNEAVSGRKKAFLKIRQYLDVENSDDHSKKLFDRNGINLKVEYPGQLHGSEIVIINDVSYSFNDKMLREFKSLYETYVKS